jgi:hypothetical protein
MDSNEMKKGGFAASAELQRQRQAARDAKSHAAPVPPSTPDVPDAPPPAPARDGVVPVAQPLPAAQVDVPATNLPQPPISLRILE